MGVYLFPFTSATKLHFFLGVFLHFITGADTAKVQAKEGSTASTYEVSGYVDGAIDLSKANVAAHQIIRFILADSAWNEYYRGDNGVDIIDTLRATKQLDWAMNNAA
ncbi:MAG: hypothetical protein HFF84_11075 [Oscillibacter sp.]|nr:hypothetical protein [Oscillibacter sp.]